MKLALLALMATAAITPVQDKPPASDDKPIVVTGRRLTDTEKALKDCIARHCPPDQDIAATLAHAENQFVAGQYKGARATLLASRGRNARFARQYPVDVSYLHRANARIAEHLGEGDAYRISTFDTVSALRAGLPDNDPRVLYAELEAADVFAKFGEPASSEAAYRAVARKAHKLDMFNVEGVALLRIAGLYFSYSLASPRDYATAARRAINDLIGNTDPRLKPFGEAASVLQAKLLLKDGDTSGVDRLIDTYKTMTHGLTPVLLFSQPVDLSDYAGFNSSGNARNRGSSINFDDQWIDVGFYVAPDGKVSDAGVLRQSASLKDFWVAPVLKSINSRRYAPLPLDKDDPGVFRIERFTLTSRWEEDVRSRIRVRGPAPRVESLDLSIDPPEPVAAAG